MFKTQYGLYAALIISCCGFMSTVIGGILSDKFEKRSRMTKANICIAGSALAIPFLSLCVLTTNNFYLSLICMAIKYFLSENWMSPAITMM